MQEILYAGFTFEEIAEGKVPYLPPKETSDFVATKHDKSFSQTTHTPGTYPDLTKG